MTKHKVSLDQVKTEPEHSLNKRAYILTTGNEPELIVAKSALSIKSILSDDLTKPIPLEQVVIGSMASQKDISPIMAELSEKIPLPFRLQHLKRVRRLQVILVPIQVMIDDLIENNSKFWSHLMSRLETNVIKNKDVYVNALAADNGLTVKLQCEAAFDYLRFKGVAESIIALLGEAQMCPNHIIAVAKVQPVLRWQFDIVSPKWPCKFHQNKTIEDQYTNTMFAEPELLFHRLIIDVLMFVRQNTGADCGLAVDPLTNSIVGLGIGEVDIHPLMHSPMVLIDAVARSQGAGAWNEFGRRLPNWKVMEDLEKSKSSYSRGIDESWRRLIQYKFPHIQFGPHITNDQVACIPKENINTNEPYLCTGYDVYLSREPCIMCAMALVHSRARTVFYKNSHQQGGLGSIAKIHTLKPLNHHYRVYKIVE